MAATPMAFVQAVVCAYEARGMDPAAVLQQAQIAPDQLRCDKARITAWQMEVLCGGAMRELGDEALGWFDRRLPWAATACSRTPASPRRTWGWRWRAGAATTVC